VSLKMGTMRLDLAYNGVGFAGWAVQPGMRTVQAALERALERILGAPVQLTAAGRTDAGVHAWSQVVSFEAPADPPETLVRGLNGLTGDDIAVIAAAPAAPGFDARRDARSRTYCYRIHSAPMPSPFERGLSLYWPHRLDVGLLEACADALLGTHDFTAFTPTQTDHVRFRRNIYRCEWKVGSPPLPAPGPMLELWVEADAFMRSMVRVLVGTMLEVAGARRSLDDFRSLLEGAPREHAGPTASPYGLHLAAVRY
jgi:tRNA pseudouridine38-40 synthase